MWTAILSFLGGPVVNGVIKAYQAKLTADGNTENINARLAASELQVQALEFQAQSELKISQIGHWTEPEHLFAYVTLVFYSKCLIWDMMLGWGSTPAPKGPVAIWAGLIMSFYFGKRGFENVARIMSRKR